jgi:hypothetical protein
MLLLPMFNDVGLVFLVVEINLLLMIIVMMMSGAFFNHVT